mmetsp:Transcript_26465/g.61709  ORF Transcript_26465/g.61709 Transcript_26465/m.61709 type:complete len:446 (+) Transcript_26465:102-1439(+)
MRIWEAWPGLNRFAMNGRWLVPSNRCPSVGNDIVMFGSLMLTIVLEFPRLLWLNVPGSIVWITVVIAFFLLGYWNYLLARAMDPGIIPRKSILAALAASPEGRPYAKAALDIFGGVSDQGTMRGVTTGHLPRDVENTSVLKDAADAQRRLDALPWNDLQAALQFWTTEFDAEWLGAIRHCGTCEMRRPHRASHCKVCDNCVLDFDHHCFYIGNCVGLRNHRPFVVYLILGAIGTGLVIAGCIVDLVFSFIEMSDRDEEVDVRGIVILAGVVAGCLVLLCLVGALVNLAGCLAQALTNMATYRARQCLSMTVIVLSALVFVAGFIALMVLLWPFPWQPIVIGLLALGEFSVLAFTALNQLWLISRGLNVKQSVARREDGHFSLMNLVRFFTFRIPPSLVPAHLDVPKELLDMDDQSDESDSLELAAPLNGHGSDADEDGCCAKCMP